MLISETEIGFSSRGFFSAWKSGGLAEKLFMEAASSAAREERMEDSTCADEDEAASLAATAAAAFLCSSSALVNVLAKEVMG